MSCGVFSALRAALRLPPEEPRADKPSKRVSPANPGFTANRDFPPDQVNQLIKSLSQADKDAEWMAVVPTKP